MTYDAGETRARYELDVSEANVAAVRIADALYRMDVAAMDRQTFELRHRRLLAEGRIGQARQLKEGFEDAQRVKATPQR